MKSILASKGLVSKDWVQNGVLRQRKQTGGKWRRQLKCTKNRPDGLTGRWKGQPRRPGSTSKRHPITPHSRYFRVTWYNCFNLIGRGSLLPYQTGEPHLSTNRHIFANFPSNCNFVFCLLPFDGNFWCCHLVWLIIEFEFNLGIVALFRMFISGGRKSPARREKREDPSERFQKILPHFWRKWRNSEDILVLLHTKSPKIPSPIWQFY